MTNMNNNDAPQETASAAQSSSMATLAASIMQAFGSACSRFSPSERDTVISMLQDRKPLSEEERADLGYDFWDSDEPEEGYHLYDEGGFHPVVLGDQLSDGRYTIIHKLGHGSFATVWLAHDDVLKRKVSIKITASVLGEDGAGLDEFGISRLLETDSSRHPGGQHVLHYLDHFSFQGRSGRHHCFVSDPTRITLHQSKFRSQPVALFPVDVARAVTAQLILGLAYIHSKGVVHGDLHMGNVMLDLPEEALAKRSVREIYTEHDLPVVFPMDVCAEVNDFNLPVPENAPPYIVGSLMFKFSEDSDKLQLSDARALISDFGESWQPDLEKKYRLHIPDNSRAPEAMVAEALGTPISYPADIWALGCIIHELFSSIDVLDMYFPGFDLAWLRMMNLLGKPPREWWEAWEDRKLFFDDEGKFCPKERIPHSEKQEGLDARVYRVIGEERAQQVARMTRKDALETVGIFHADELGDLLPMLKQIFCWLPEDRATAEDLASGPWMKNWGLPAIAAMEQAYADKAKKMPAAHSVIVVRNRYGALWASTWASAAAIGFGIFMRIFGRATLGVTAGWWSRLRRAVGI